MLCAEHLSLYNWIFNKYIIEMYNKHTYKPSIFKCYTYSHLYNKQSRHPLGGERLSPSNWSSATALGQPVCSGVGYTGATRRWIWWTDIKKCRLIQLMWYWGSKENKYTIKLIEGTTNNLTDSGQTVFWMTYVPLIILGDELKWCRWLDHGSDKLMQRGKASHFIIWDINSLAGQIYID